VIELPFNFDCLACSLLVTTLLDVRKYNDCTETAYSDVIQRFSSHGFTRHGPSLVRTLTGSLVFKPRSFFSRDVFENVQRTSFVIKKPVFIMPDGEESYYEVDSGCPIMRRRAFQRWRFFSAYE
jgi:hypothetical protein